MRIQEFLNYRKDILNSSKDDEGFVQQTQLLSQILPLLFDAKLLDSEDWNDSYFLNPAENLKLNGYTVNESSERLQLFIINEKSIDINASVNDLQISTKSQYDYQFKRATKFLNKAIKGYLNDEVQDADPIRPLISQLSSSSGAEQFDVVEIFLISATATTETRGAIPQPKRIDFEDETITVSYTKNRERIKKDLLIIKKLIDLNFLYDVMISQGNREALFIDFENLFNYKIEVIKAAEEENFESYLCVLPASILSELYKRYSTRLLEKNVRSFLQFKGVNKGIRETIRVSPEKFIAFNNGITITSIAKELEIINGKMFIKSLTDFQIVNGGQTTASIYFTQKDGFPIDKVKIMAKINVALDVTEEGLDTLISDISRFSNSQTKVSNVDLSSRSPQLSKLKALSESIVTPSGRKWFFEKSRGEFNTKLRIAGSNKARIEKEYPINYRFSKEQLGKYFTAWGDQPYIVKKGGEKVFRYFLEEITSETKGKKPINVNREFYEELISKIILFKELEKIYGQGKHAIGQIRSAVIPYSISVLYNFTSNSSDRRMFDLRKLWISEGLENDLANYLTELMRLMNDLIKMYSGSDDYGEYSKKEELWVRISNSFEIRSFIESQNSKKILNKYTVTIEELAKRNLKSSKKVQVDFKDLRDSIYLNSNGDVFYSKIIELFNENMSKSDCLKLESIISSIIHFEDIDQKHIKFEQELIHKIMNINPGLFDEITFEPNTQLIYSLDFIIQTYNNSIESQTDIALSFKKIQEKAIARGIKYASVYDQIGHLLSLGLAPSVKQIHDASFYFQDGDTGSSTNDSRIKEIKIPIDLVQLKKMVEWDSKFKILTNNERQYLADFAYGLKKINAFHENIAKKHLQTLIKAGYKIS